MIIPDEKLKDAIDILYNTFEEYTLVDPVMMNFLHRTTNIINTLYNKLYLPINTDKKPTLKRFVGGYSRFSHKKGRELGINVFGASGDDIRIIRKYLVIARKSYDKELINFWFIAEIFNVCGTDILRICEMFMINPTYNKIRE